jgi:pantoate--beta-alanine ligase
MTMGALHDGHLSLVRRSTEECDFTAVTIYVNPTQFGPGEDFERYPRNLKVDLELLGECPVDLVFAPQTEDMFPTRHSTFVDPPDVSIPWEGQCRPGHFRGVTTVVLKLLQAVPADTAYFGQKDYQQFLVLQKMTTDLDIPVRLVSCPIVRDADGLALSSRNRYLSPEERTQGLALSRSLSMAQELIHDGERRTSEVTVRMRDALQSAGIERIDYVAVADLDTLEELRHIDRRCVALLAAHVGQTRLIDNRILTVR